MNKIIYILLTMISIFAMEAQAKVATFTMTFSEKDFTYDTTQYGETFIYAENFSVHYKENGEPCLPYIAKTVAMAGNYIHNSSTYSLGQTFLVKNTTLANAPEVMPTSKPYKTNAIKPANYEIKTYPSENVELTAVSRWDNLTLLHYIVCPYTYDAKNKTLLFSNRMTLTINYDIGNDQSISGDAPFFVSTDDYDYTIGFLPMGGQKFLDSATDYSYKRDEEKRSYHPMLQDGDYWVSLTFWPGLDDQTSLNRIEVCGDITVYDETVKLMKNTRTYADGRVTEDYFTAYERDRCVYYGTPGNSSKLMDFNYNVGEPTTNNTEVVSVDYTDDNRKIIILKNGDIRHCWIEGIGSDTDWVWEGTIKPTAYMYDMFLYHDNDKIPGEFFHKDQFPIGRGVFLSGNKFITADAEDGKMYNLDGMEISVPQEGEIFIRNGKKHINK